MTEYEQIRMQSMDEKQKRVFRKFISSCNSASRCRKKKSIISCEICSLFNECTTQKKISKYLKSKR